MSELWKLMQNSKLIAKITNAIVVISSMYNDYLTLKLMCGVLFVLTVKPK
jgi:hypothetical protein